MNLVIVHYHLRPGGIRRVIELATPHLLRALKNVTTVTLACGEANDAKWNQQFAALLKPARLEIRTEPSFNYFSEQQGPPRRIQNRIRAALEQLLAGANATNCIVWAHNLGIGRNLLLSRELALACAARGVTLLSHHHDLWFDNRWQRRPEIRRAGFRRLTDVARTIFPGHPAIRHIGINSEDADQLQQHFPATAAWLPNPVPQQAPQRLHAVRAARRWIAQTLNDPAAPVWILPCRLLRRKNVAEALLLTRWLRPEAWLVTTGGASSADELDYFRRLQQAAQQQHWRLRLGVLQGDETGKPGVAELMAASEAVLLTSIQEGFGLPYLEAAAAQRPLIARHLPNVAPDLRKFGFRFPQAYEEILVAPELFDWPAERARQRTLFARWRNHLPTSVRSHLATPVLLDHKTAGPVPFSRLTLTAQLELLAQPVARSWELCAPLNPFLRGWQRRAATGTLQATVWPQRADDWLSGATYADKFAALIRARAAASKPAVATALQTALLRKKLCSANLYPLLWATAS